jgi:peptide/nickel transport system permease protein
MISFIVRRLVQTAIVVLLVTIISFLLMQLIPGDPVLTILGTEATQEQIDALRKELFLDRPVYEQYIHWLNNSIHGDFGTSITLRQSVSKLLTTRIPITLYLALLAFIGSVVLGIIFGILSAIRRGSWLDNVVSLLANTGVAVPVFWLGILGIYLFGLTLHWLPLQGYTSPFEDFIKSTRQAIMPVICLGLPFLAILTRQTRSSMLEVIRNDYIRTAMAKGLTERVIVFKHALRNALIPIVTLTGINLRTIIGGSVLVETVFNIPGMGRLLVLASFNKDFQVVQASLVIISLITCLSNLAVDISYGWIDPRVRYD